MELILDMKNIDKEFPGVKALDQCNLEILKGEVHALMGENGAGKSTLIKILVGIYQKNSGEIIFEGKKVEYHNSRESQEAGISIIYQEFNLIPKLTVAENIYLGRQPKKNGLIDWDTMVDNSQKLLDSLNANIDPYSKIEDLGVAQQQLVEIAKALSVNIKILAMDEPTAALTDKEIDNLFEIVKKLRSQGISIIYISHRMEEITKISDRATIMRDGKYIGTVEIKNVTIDDIISMMVGRDLREQYPKEEHQKGKIVLKVENIVSGKMVKDVSFEVYEGEIVGFAGLMGAGRTETMRAIFGADKKSSGKIYIGGKSVQISSPEDAIENGIGFLTEDRKNQGLVLNMSVKENMTITNLEKILNKFNFLNLNKEKEISEEFKGNLKIKTPSVLQKAKLLSGGNQQKVVLAKWLNRDCKILIFDEPTRGIDVGAKNEIYKLMNRLVKDGIAIIMISSEMPEVIGMSDRIYVMHEGEITGEVKSDQASQSLIMNYAIGNRVYEKNIGGKS